MCGAKFSGCEMLQRGQLLVLPCDQASAEIDGLNYFSTTSAGHEPAGLSSFLFVHKLGYSGRMAALLQRWLFLLTGDDSNVISDAT